MLGIATTPFLESPLALMSVVVCAIFLGVLFILGMIKSFTRKTAGWIVLTVIAGIMGLACIVTFLARVGYLMKDQIAERRKIENVFTVNDGKYSITVPNNWKKHDELNSDADLGVGNLVLEQYLLLFVEKKEDLSMNLDEYAQYITDETAANLIDANVGDLIPLNVNGLRGLQRRFVGETEGVRATFIHTCVETEDSLCQILCWTLPSKEKSAFQVFEKVVQTFSVNPARKVKAENSVE